jgi:PIN domain nuclease of toxin-antitoxin system
MKLLLDTHTFLWWITDDLQLSPKAHELISDSYNTMYWSAASSWEVSIKYALGRLPLPETPEQFLPVELGKNRIESLSVIGHGHNLGHYISHRAHRVRREKLKKLCDLCGLCETTKKCLQLSKFLMVEIRTNPL